MRLSAVILAALLALGGAAQASVVPAPGPNDPRIRMVPYTPDEVVLVTGTLGYAVTVEFGEGERIETVSIGDSLGWQVTPNRRANVLFLKPVDRAKPTNMTVVTNLRTYTLELRTRARARADDPAVIYAVKFDYPEPAMAAVEPPPPPPPPEPPKDVNHAYSFSGAKDGLPIRVFDDGVSTYFTFAGTAEFPAIFAVDADKKEASVNVAQHDGFVVVDRLAQAFVLRRGAEVTRIFNDGYHTSSEPTALGRHKGR